jgi:hypothetical protein
MEIGKSIMKMTDDTLETPRDDGRAMQAIPWMQRAFSIAEKGIKESKVSIQQKVS